MSFGQSSGPPASVKQVSYLLSLVQQAGHDGFRDARHPLGLTQRQSSGKFTSTEASELVERLEGGGIGNGAPADGASPIPTRLESEQAKSLRGMPAELLSVELERRGWLTMPPPS